VEHIAANSLQEARDSVPKHTDICAEAAVMLFRLLLRVLLAEMLDMGQRQQAHSSTEEGGLATYTHAVGLGYGKSGKLQQTWLKQQEDAAALKLQLPQLSFISNSCEVSSGSMQGF
jgi:hypothetical protein